MSKTCTKKLIVPKEMYNVDLKTRFIEYYYDKDYTKENIKKLFYLTNLYMESKLEKDLYEFSKEEVEQMLLSFRTKSVNSLNSKVSILRHYVDFAINVSDIRENAINNFATIRTYDLDRYVGKSVYKYMYITRDTLYEICNMIYNPQDAVAYVLLFEGVKGKELRELRSLKSTDVDIKKRTITIQGYKEETKNGGIKEVPTRVIGNIDERSLEIIQMAITQDIYYRGNSIDTEMGKSLDRELKLDSTDYIIRKALLNIETDASGGMIEKQVIMNRMMKVEKYIDSPELVKMLNPTNLFYSGMLEELAKIKDIKGCVEAGDFKQVVVSREMDKYSYQNLKKAWDETYQKGDSFRLGVNTTISSILYSKRQEELNNIRKRINKRIQGITSERRLVKVRRGQDLLRKWLILKECRCKICGITDPNFLRVSHIKRWADCSNKERLDFNNAILLYIEYDYLFDKGYITFEDNGSIVISEYLSKDVIKQSNLNSNIKIDINRRQIPYLKWHRENIFEHFIHDN